MYTNQGGDANSVSLEMLFLKDNVDAGTTWTTTGSKLNGLDAKCITTVKEKGISMTINGVEYTDIIHTQVDVQVKNTFCVCKCCGAGFLFCAGRRHCKKCYQSKVGRCFCNHY